VTNSRLSAEVCECVRMVLAGERLRCDTRIRFCWFDGRRFVVACRVPSKGVLRLALAIARRYSVRVPALESES
jgi:hypothetical protein